MNQILFRKRFIGFAFILGFLCLTILLSDGKAFAATTIYDKFNADVTGGTPSGWTTDTSGGTVQVSEVPFPTDKSVAITKTATTNAATITKTFTPITGRAIIEYRVVVTDNMAGNKMAPYIYDENGNPIVKIELRSDFVRAYNGAANYAVSGITLNEWTIIKVVLDTNTKKYDLFIDGIKRVTDYSFSTTTGTSAASLKFSVPSGQTGVMNIDEVRIYDYESLVTPPSGTIINITSAPYNAVGDGVTDNTYAIRQAIADVPAGGTVYVPSGKFVTGGLDLKSNMTLYVDLKGTLLAKPDESAFPDHDETIENWLSGAMRRAFIYIGGATNVRLDGGGTIDGNAGNVANWHSGASYDIKIRPNLIKIYNSDTVSVKNLYLKDAPAWLLFPLESNNITIKDIVIYSIMSGNKDGIDPSNCSNVLIENSQIYTEDDAIVPKSGSARFNDNVTVRNIFINGSTAANALKLGTNSYGQFKNYLFEDVYIKRAQIGGISLALVDGVVTDNITFRRINMSKVQGALFIQAGYRGQKPASAPVITSDIKNISFEDIKARNLTSTIGSGFLGNITSTINFRLSNLSFKNIDIQYPGGLSTVPASPAEYDGTYPELSKYGNLPAYGFYLRHVDGITLDNVNISAASTDARQPIVMEDVSKVNVYNEAENGSINGEMQVVNDSTASGGKYIVTPNPSGFNLGNAYSDLTFQVYHSGTYYLWGKTKAPTQEDNSFFIKVGSNPEATWHMNPSTSWTWNKVTDNVNPYSFSLTPGTYTIRVRDREDGTPIDKLLLTSDSAYIPAN
ncbi:glycoside hydrolase family 28 protein [Paenibacillus roseipurpureus]|uniref:Glycosyl hydrolase family 28 protein n=1 Tax=Paenibacillus roseopurpureus TaxID=2918901 RepID=A0AA96LT12_9BACL|nr:glycosyl hydrolase family 28 protein [Paenibacillus sp. MBLB1832]WNR45549.1 glycosyl hydrolase family 28 protein [Paenibacillus sp. MBLB1832]